MIDDIERREVTIVDVRGGISSNKMYERFKRLMSDWYREKIPLSEWVKISGSQSLK